MPAQAEPRSPYHGWSMSRDLDQGFTSPLGERGQIEYKPNWGQPIVGGQWRGAGAAPTQAQAQAIDPRGIVDARLESLRNNFKQWGNDFKKTNPTADKWNKALAVKQAEYDQDKGRLTGVVAQLDYIEQLATSGAVTPEAAYKASVSSVLPASMVSTLFPAAPTPSTAGHTPGTRQTLAEHFADIGQTSLAYKDKAWYRWDVKQIDSKKIKEIYEGERRIANLNDPRNVNRIPGFNAAFVEGMSADPRTMKAFDELIDKKTGDSDMKRWFAPPSQLTNIFNRKVDKSVSPLGRAFMGTAKPTGKIRVKSPDGVTGTIDANELQQHLAQGFTRI